MCSGWAVEEVMEPWVGKFVGILDVGTPEVVVEGVMGMLTGAAGGPVKAAADPFGVAALGRLGGKTTCC